MATAYRTVFYNKPEFKSKIAAFDLDWTLIRPNEGRIFPKSADDWDWLYDKKIILGKIKEYIKNDYMFVIITNQGGKYKFKVELIQNVLVAIGIPCVCIIGHELNIKKPNKDLFYTMFDDEWCLYKNKVDYKESFYVGDAAGREFDWAGSDKEFADNVGIKFNTPEHFFEIENNMDITTLIPKIKLDPSKQYVVVMIGYPGSGKSSIAKNILSSQYGFVHIEKDVIGTDAKVKKEALVHIKNNKSVVIDALNTKEKNRKVFIDFAKKNNIDVICIHVETSIEKSMVNNTIRAGLGKGVKIPPVVYYVYRKGFEEPNKEEGFDKIITVSLD